MKTSVDDFYRGTTKEFEVKIWVNGINPGIEADTVTFTMKKKKGDTDANAVIQKDADVATSGAGGLALFSISKTETDIAPRRYFYDIQWIKDTGEEEVLTTGSLMVLDRISDV